MTMSGSLSGSFSRVLGKLKFSSTSSSRKSSRSSKKSNNDSSSSSSAVKTSSTSSSGSSSSFNSILTYTNRIFRKKRADDPREIVFTASHKQHQEILNNFTWTFGNRQDIADGYNSDVSPRTSGDFLRPLM